MARVKQLRLEQGLTQEKFAENAGLDYKYYQHVEAGRRPNLGLETMLKLAKGCGLELWELLKFDGPVPALGEPRGNEFRVRTGRKPSKRTAR
jgi:transcriptional regulator with XRE-family HTH domain